MKKWITLGVAAAVLLGGLGFGGYTLYSLTATPPEEEALGLQIVPEGQPVEVRRADIESRVVLDAVIAAEPGVAVKTRTGGTVARVWLTDGQSVEQGAPILTLTVEGGAASGDDDAEPAPVTRVVRAPASGTVSGLGDLAVGDPVEPGEVAQITQNKFRAVATVPANDLYLFYDEPEEILLQIDRGPAPEECEFLSLGSPSNNASGEAGGAAADQTGGSEGGLELACRVPDGMRVFSGMRGQLSIVTDKAKNALVVPMTAVRGTVNSGEVLVVLEDGTTEVREVELGVSDGEEIEVRSGLSPGDLVMDPIPLAEEFDVPSGVTEDEYYEDLDSWMLEE